jgi:hypothetical protein
MLSNVRSYRVWALASREDQSVGIGDAKSRPPVSTFVASTRPCPVALAGQVPARSFAHSALWTLLAAW